MYKSLLGCACARQALLCWEVLRLPDAFAELAEWVESARQDAEGIWLYAKGVPVCQSSGAFLRPGVTEPLLLRI